MLRAALDGWGLVADCGQDTDRSSSADNEDEGGEDSSRGRFPRAYPGGLDGVSYTILVVVAALAVVGLLIEWVLVEVVSVDNVRTGAGGFEGLPHCRIVFGEGDPSSVIIRGDGVVVSCHVGRREEGKVKEGGRV